MGDFCVKACFLYGLRLRGFIRMRLLLGYIMGEKNVGWSNTFFKN